MAPTANKSWLSLLAWLAALLSGSCATERPPEEVFNELAEPFVFDALALTPIAATEAGYHEHVRGGEGEEGETATVTALDTLLDDFSSEGVAERSSFYKDFLARLHAEVNRDRLQGDAWADYAVIENKVAQELFDLETVRTHEHNPALYVELIGRALFGPLVFEYAPKTDRYRHVIARMERIPAFLEQAKQNLQAAPDTWTEVAREENDGNINLVEKVIPAGLPDELRADYDSAAEKALAALREFNTYLTSDLAKRNQHDWRLGPELYGRKFDAWLATSPDDLLAEAEADFAKTYEQIVETARPVHRKIYGNQRPPNELALMRDVLEVLADDNRLRSADQIIDQIKKDLEELRKFVADAGITNVPSRDNLQVIETPEFLRGVYTVAGFMGAPPLEPQLNAYYWVTPIPSDATRSQVIERLRQYNLFRLKLLTIHEAMPGHYIQAEFANQGTPDLPSFRRVMRSVFANGPYVEGWASYITSAAIQAGYRSGSPEFQVYWLMEKLRIEANAILDIRLHAMDMSDEEALDLLRTKAFQSAVEAQDKLRRAKLTSAQLPLYYFGWKQWLRVRDHYQTETTDFSLTSFHDKALRAGPAPLPEIAYLTSQRPMK